MDKADTDSLATVTVKEYPPSEAFGSEPPPAYQKLRPTSVQIARIAAVTLVCMSVVLGMFILAAAYVNATYSCQNALSAAQPHAEASEAQPRFQRLVDLQGLSQEKQAAVDANRLPPAPAAPARPQASQEEADEAEEGEREGEGESEEGDEEETTPVRIKLPLTLDFDDLAGALVERNQRSRMNCVVEKRRAEQVVDHQPRTLRLPFGLNVSTDPRYEHVSGERMAIFCESGKEQRRMPMEATPIVVPLPGPVHLPLQFQGHLQQAQAHAAAVEQAQAQAMQQAQAMHQAQAMQQAQAMHQAQAMQQARGRSFPQPHPHQVLAHLQQHLQQQAQLKEQHLQRMQAMRLRQEQMEEEREQLQDREQAAAAAAAMHASLRLLHAPPAPPSGPAPPQQQQRQTAPLQLQAITDDRHIPLQFAEARHIPIQVSGGEAEAAAAEAVEPMEAAAVGVTLREGRALPFARLPVHVPLPLVQVAVEPQEDAPRPHYVQPRSVRSKRSVDEVFLHKRDKRMRRCACDCAC